MELLIRYLDREVTEIYALSINVILFIVACNLLGLIPFLGGFNITGTIGVTIVLAGLVFIITTINGNKHY